MFIIDWKRHKHKRDMAGNDEKQGNGPVLSGKMETGISNGVR